MAGGRRAVEHELEFGTTILGSESDDTPRLVGLGGDPDRTVFGVRGVIGVNGVIGVIGVIGVTGVIGGILPSAKKHVRYGKSLSLLNNIGHTVTKSTCSYMTQPLKQKLSISGSDSGGHYGPNSKENCFLTISAELAFVSVLECKI